MSSYSVMHSIHVWMGTASSAASLEAYFRVDPTRRAAGLSASQFDQDVGLTWYDDDLIGVYYADAPSLDACLDELPTSAATIAEMRAAYLATGDIAPNALFYYTDADLTIAEPNQLFCGLRYLGVFDNS